jgi:hypothetical protein
MCLRCGAVEYPYRSWPSGPAGPGDYGSPPDASPPEYGGRRPAGSLGSEPGAATTGWPRAGGTGAARSAGTSSPGCASAASHPSITNGLSCLRAGTGCAGPPRPSPAVRGRRLARHSRREAEGGRGEDDTAVEHEHGGHGSQADSGGWDGAIRHGVLLWTTAEMSPLLTGVRALGHHCPVASITQRRRERPGCRRQ